MLKTQSTVGPADAGGIASASTARIRKSAPRTNTGVVVQGSFRGKSGAAVLPLQRDVVADYIPKTCQWIDGDARERRTKGDAIFCGAPVVEGTSWCEDHLPRVRIKKVKAEEGDA